MTPQERSALRQLVDAGNVAPTRGAVVCLIDDIEARDERIRALLGALPKCSIRGVVTCDETATFERLAARGFRCDEHRQLIDLGEAEAAWAELPWAASVRRAQEVLAR